MCQFQTRYLEGLQLQVKRLAPVLSRAICTNSRWWQFRKWDVKGNVVCSVLRKAGGLNAVQMWGLGCAVKQVMTCRRPYSPSTTNQASSPALHSALHCTQPTAFCTVQTREYTLQQTLHKIIHTGHKCALYCTLQPVKVYGNKMHIASFWQHGVICSTINPGSTLKGKGKLSV